MDNNRVDIGDIHPGLDDRGGYQHINVPLDKFIHDPLQVMLFHLSVGKCHMRLRYQFLDPVRHLPDALHPVIDIIDLSLPVQLSVDRRPHHLLIILTHIGLHRHPVHGRFLQNAHIPYPCQAHMQRPWDRSGTQGEHIHTGLQFLDLLLVRHAEALLLVYDQKSQILVLHIL